MIGKLEEYFEDNKFFRKQKRNVEKRTINHLYRNMRYLELEEHCIVFDYDDPGELFYIIMEG